LPIYDKNEEEYLRNEKKNFTPWIVFPSFELKLDHDDPLGSGETVNRPIFCEKIVNAMLLQRDDPFGRVWKNSSGKVCAESQAWGVDETNREGASLAGSRLICAKHFLKQLLKENKADLLVLVNLQRYQKGIGHESGKFFNTIGLAHISRTMRLSFHIGAVNKLHENSH
jgi:hypothetical protein